MKEKDKKRKQPEEISENPSEETLDKVSSKRQKLLDSLDRVQNINDVHALFTAASNFASSVLTESATTTSKLQKLFNFSQTQNSKMYQSKVLSALLCACEASDKGGSNYVESLCALLGCEKDSNNTYNILAEPLSIAMDKKNIRMIEVLLDYGAPIPKNYKTMDLTQSASDLFTLTETKRSNATPTQTEPSASQHPSEAQSEAAIPQPTEKHNENIKDIEMEETGSREIKLNRASSRIPLFNQTRNIPIEGKTSKTPKK